MRGHEFRDWIEQQAEANAADTKARRQAEQSFGLFDADVPSLVDRVLPPLDGAADLSDDEPWELEP